MRHAVLLVVLAVLLGCDGKPAKPRTKTATPRVTPLQSVPPRPASKPESKPPRPRAERPAVVDDDESQGGSPLDDLANMAADAPTATEQRNPELSESVAAKHWLVVNVHDGDTVTCLDDDGRQQKVRLVGIDAPEIGQPFGTKARDQLTTLTLRKSVEVEVGGQDRYGRTLARIEVEGQDVNREMVAAGMAWHFTRYSDDAALAAAEVEARAAGRGLWADPEPVAPWEWRATERERRESEREPAEPM